MGIKSSSIEFMPFTRSIQRVRQISFNFFLSASGACNSMQSSNESCLGSEKLKKYDNYFIFSIIFATLCIFQVLHMLKFSL